MLIGIYSPVAGSGKSTAADYLITNHNFTRLSFAEPIKEMVRILLENFGYSPHSAHHMLYTCKHAPIPEIDYRVDARHLLRTLGTEWGRQCVHPEIWLRCWTARYRRLIADGYENIVVDDMRFLNEAALLYGSSAELWAITRPGVEGSTEHASEGGLDFMLPPNDSTNDSSMSFTQILDNSGTLDELYSQIDNLLTL